VQISFANKKLERLFLEGKGAEKLPEGVYFSFVAAVRVLLQINDERELYLASGLRPEKLGGNRKGQNSIRLNAQFRLVYSIETDTNGKYILILELVDYH
jgi:toxin HigB-1